MTLDLIGGAAGAWLIAALALAIAELLVPGVFLIFLAIAAGIVAAMTVAIGDLPVPLQFLGFAIWSAVVVAIGRIDPLLRVLDLQIGIGFITFVAQEQQLAPVDHHDD